MTGELTAAQIGLCSVRLTGSDMAVAECHLLLGAEESRRAERFRFPGHRREFILAHGVLRALLAHHSSAPPHAIRFRYGERQKPALEFPENDLRFNLSHSGGLAVYALTRGVEVGVDVEQIRTVEDLSGVAERFFCPAEAAELAALEAEVRERAFFTCWTRKEAYVKAMGDGLFRGLDSFQVTLHPAVPARFVHVGNSLEEARQWTLHALSLPDGYAGAIAYQAPARELVSAHLGAADDALARLRG